MTDKPGVTSHTDFLLTLKTGDSVYLARNSSRRKPATPARVSSVGRKYLIVTRPDGRGEQVEINQHSSYAITRVTVGTPTGCFASKEHHDQFKFAEKTVDLALDRLYDIRHGRHHLTYETAVALAGLLGIKPEGRA